MRVLVCGGRDFQNYESVCEELDAINHSHGIDLIIEGGARGADLLAKKWAQWKGVALLEIPADWDDLSHPDARVKQFRDGRKYDANAGARRNQKMLDCGQPDLCVAFPGGSGTKDMIAKARKSGVDVLEVRI
jgi:hypothetical protein